VIYELETGLTSRVPRVGEEQVVESELLGHGFWIASSIGYPLQEG
jgi:hypothetical protein